MTLEDWDWSVIAAVWGFGALITWIGLRVFSAGTAVGDGVVEALGLVLLAAPLFVCAALTVQWMRIEFYVVTAMGLGDFAGKRLYLGRVGSDVPDVTEDPHQARRFRWRSNAVQMASRANESMEWLDWKPMAASRLVALTDGRGGGSGPG
jgi:hypothetical protein